MPIRSRHRARLRLLSANRVKAAAPSRGVKNRVLPGRSFPGKRESILVRPVSPQFATEAEPCSGTFHPQMGQQGSGANAMENLSNRDRTHASFPQE